MPMTKHDKRFTNIYCLEGCGRKVSPGNRLRCNSCLNWGIGVDEQFIHDSDFHPGRGGQMEKQLRWELDDEFVSTPEEPVVEDGMSTLYTASEEHKPFQHALLGENKYDTVKTGMTQEELKALVPSENKKSMGA